MSEATSSREQVVLLAPAAGAATDVGRFRSVNEDGYLAAAPAFIVVDGMGGHALGRAATQKALDALAPLSGTCITDQGTVVDAVVAAGEAVAAIPSESSHRPGATIAGVVAADLPEGRTWIVLNIGDARVYLRRSGALRQVTRDHSQVQALIDARLLTPAEARRDPRRNVVTRALGAGISGPAVPDIHLLPIEAGDRLLVCSDKRVVRLMRKMGLEGQAPGPSTSKPHPEHKVYPYLLRGLEITSVNQVWSTDITYIPLRQGYMYLAAVMDWYSRYVLSWELSNSQDSKFYIMALETALRRGICIKCIYCNSEKRCFKYS